MKKLGIQNLDNLKDEEGNLNEDKAVEAIRLHQAEILKQDPTFIDPIKKSISDKLSEEKIVAIKQLKKSFKTLAGIDVTNDQLNEMSAEDLFKLGFSNKVDNAEVAKLQNDIIELAKAKQAIEESTESKINEVVNRYESQFQTEKIENELLKAMGSTEFIVENETAKILLKSKLANDGITMLYDKEKKQLVFKQGEYEALKADRTGKADIKYYVETYLSDVTKKSNGSGGNGGSNPIIDADKLSKLPKELRENLARLNGVS